jgi:hypothetical protein
MPTFDDDGHTIRVKDFVNQGSDLPGHSLLHLQAAGEHLHNTGNFAQADYLVSGEIGNLSLAVEGQQMVFAQTEKFDIPYDNHVTVIYVEQSTVD